MRTIVLTCVLLAACQPQEEQVEHCHANGYTAKTQGLITPVECCSALNGDDVCIHADRVTKHRSETWPQ
jgi:hypothetical protein